MKTFPNARMLPIVLAVTLAACGGGDSGDSGTNGNSGTAVPSTTMTGAAVDGYLQNAKACLDLDDSMTCDNGEPTATTDAKGLYALTAPSLDAANNHHVVVEAVAGVTVDADAPGTPISKGYVLVAPIGQHAVISPISTLAHQLQLEQPGLTTEEALQQVRHELALSSDLNLSADFAVSNATAEQQHLHNIAKTVALKLADGIEAIETALGRPLTVDERKKAHRILMRHLLNNAQAIAAQVSSGSAPDKVNVDGLDINNLTAQMAMADTTPVVVADPLGAVAGGLVVPAISSAGTMVAAAYNLNAVKRIDSTSTPLVEAEWTNYRYQASINGFEKTTSNDTETVLKDGHWTVLAGKERCTYTRISGAVRANCNDGVQYDLFLHQLAIAGKSIDAVLRFGFGSYVADAWNVATTRQFGTSAKAYLGRYRQTTDRYSLYEPVRIDSNTYASLDAAMAATTTTGGQSFWLGGMLRASFDNTTGSQGELTLNAVDGHNGDLVKLPLKGRWTRQVVGDETLLEFTVPAEYQNRIFFGLLTRTGWSVSSVTGTALVHRYYAELTGSMSHGVLLNGSALETLTSARNTGAAK